MRLDETDPFAFHEIFGAGSAALEAAGWRRVEELGYPPYLSYAIEGNELTLEPLTFGRVALALYRDHELVWPAKIEFAAGA